VQRKGEESQQYNRSTLYQGNAVPSQLSKGLKVINPTGLAFFWPPTSWKDKFYAFKSHYETIIGHWTSSLIGRRRNLFTLYAIISLPHYQNLCFAKKNGNI
jgi:hypothetical protein